MLVCGDVYSAELHVMSLLFVTNSMLCSVFFEKYINIVACVEKKFSAFHVPEISILCSKIPYSEPVGSTLRHFSNIVY
jgi:hypothetical protein